MGVPEGEIVQKHGLSAFVNSEERKEGQSKKRHEGISHDNEKHNSFSSALLNNTLELLHGTGIIT